MTRQAVSTLVLLLVVLLVFWRMRAGWRARTRRSSALVPALPVAPAFVFLGLGALLGRRRESEQRLEAADARVDAAGHRPGGVPSGS